MLRPSVRIYIKNKVSNASERAARQITYLTLWLEHILQTSYYEIVYIFPLIKYSVFGIIGRHIKRIVPMSSIELNEHMTLVLVCFRRRGGAKTSKKEDKTEDRRVVITRVLKLVMSGPIDIDERPSAKLGDS